MESVLDTLKPVAEDATEQTRYNSLVKAHLKLIDEKQHLEDALFRFRQKLLSVGNLATSAADSATAQLPSEGHDETPSSEAVQWTLDAGAPLQDAAIFHLASSEYCIPGPPMSASCGSPWALGHSSLPLGLLDLDAASSALPIPPPIQMSQTGFLAQFLPPGGSDTAVSAVINNSTIFADQVKLAAKNIMSRWIEPSANDDHESYAIGHRDRLVRKLAAIAVEVIGALAGLEPYIYGVYFSKYMESVVRWRLSNTLEDRLQIPPPFRPTPLQFTSPDYPMVIDFINWPSIRDQMILHSSTLDLDAMSRDIVLNTVIELPNQRVAVNIYDIFFSHILPRAGGGRAQGDKSMLHNREWVYLKVPADSTKAFLSNSFSITQDALASEMTSRMGLRSEAIDQVRDAHGPRTNTTGRTALCGPHMTVSQALSAFGIDQPCKWKLSRDFQRKYSYIDCSLDVSDYEMVPASTVALDHVCRQN
ncbi:hypothetical protein ACJ41O_013222 [Fusarium nematophilum]